MATPTNQFKQTQQQREKVASRCRAWIFRRATTTINEKLVPSTFPQWRAQFEALLIGYDLIDFVTGIHKCPAIDALNFTTSKAPNSYWIRQDKLILHAILASTSTTITPLLTAYKTSH